MPSSSLPYRSLVYTTDAVDSVSQDESLIQQALVIGIGAYEAGLGALDNAPRDAIAVAETLEREYGFALLPAGQPLLDGQAGLQAIRRAVSESLQRADRDTRWLFYFAGHGLVVDEQGYLLPVDAVRQDANTYLALPWLLDQCLESQCRETLIVLDACYGGRMLVRPDYLSDFIPSEGGRDRVRQLVTSGNPDQPVLDGGGSGHSVFTRSLLEALQGWAGIHEADERGNVIIRFSRLLDHLVFDVPGRLRIQGLNAARQQPVGGNLVGRQDMGDFVFRSIVPRLSSETVREIRSEDAERRRVGLARLIDDGCQGSRSLAIQLAVRHLAPEPRRETGFFVTSTLNYEPDAQVRAQAARTVGELAASSGDDAVLDPLVDALDDVAPVCRAAARALGQLGVPRAAVPLLDRLRDGDREVFLDCVGAIGALGELETTLEALRESLRRDLLVPFVGPDLPASLTGLPERIAVAHELARREGIPLADSLAQVAEAAMMGGTRYVFTAFMKRALDDQLVQPGAIHQALARLGASFWISGAYDGLLPRCLNADTIVMGEDVKYWQAGRTNVLRLAGDLTSNRALLVLEGDYERLREGEGDRRLFVEYLKHELDDKVVLILGYDPSSPDFALLVKHVLSGYLGTVDVCVFLVWPEVGPQHKWGERPIQSICQEPLTLVDLLGAQSI